MRLLLALADGIDGMSRLLGRGVKWLAVLLVLVQFTVVVIRYAFGSSFIMMQESVVYIHAALFMLAIGYVYMLDAHVRVDFFYAGWSEKKKAWTDLLGVLITVLPFCWLLVWASWGYVSMSFRLGEGPMAVGGLPLLPYLKSLILVMAGLLALQSVSVMIRALGVITGATDKLFPWRQAVSEG
jgi:TRAP-type mannitol/chloroaromatic compound transport system permease small subunit